MAENSIGERKRALRVAALSQRSALAREVSLSLGGLAQARAVVLPPYEAASAVILYSPIQNEIPIEKIRDDALGRGKRVFYPKLTTIRSVAVAEIRSAADFSIGRLGIGEPLGPPLGIDADVGGCVVFLPGLVFDPRGNRLGRGVGWYDRLLQRLRTGAVFVGLAYEFQITDEVPTDPWDQKVHYVVTEKRVIDCSPARRQSIAVL